MPLVLLFLLFMMHYVNDVSVVVIIVIVVFESLEFHYHSPTIAYIAANIDTYCNKHTYINSAELCNCVNWCREQHRYSIKSCTHLCFIIGSFGFMELFIVKKRCKKRYNNGQVTRRYRRRSFRIMQLKIEVDLKSKKLIRLPHDQTCIPDT